MKAEREASFLTDLNQNIRIVHRVCRTYFYRDAVEREDVFQDIMYQLWKSHPQFKGESKLSTWIYRSQCVASENGVFKGCRCVLVLVGLERRTQTRQNPIDICVNGRTNQNRRIAGMSGMFGTGVLIIPD